MACIVKSRETTSFVLLPLLLLLVLLCIDNSSVAGMTMAMTMIGNNVESQRLTMIVENFRPVAGTTRMYRCASTDGLARLPYYVDDSQQQQQQQQQQAERRCSSSSSSVPSSVSSSSLSTISSTATASAIDDEEDDEARTTVTAEAIILRRAGLIVDLRSAAERDEALATQWMNVYGFQAVDGTSAAAAATAAMPVIRRRVASGATGGVVVVEQDDRDDDESSLSSMASTTTSTCSTSTTTSSTGPSNKTMRTVLRIDVQPHKRILDYLTQHWLTPVQRGWNAVWTVVDSAKQYELRMDTLNERGLSGLYEAILETGGDDLCLALRRMTEHLEVTATSTAASDESVVVFHCVKGKDRTGIVAMLCQSILDLSDDEMVAEYAQSEQLLTLSEDERYSKTVKSVKGKFDKQRFAGSPPQAMRDTLAYVRSRYGSISPGYLDHIGFDAAWRDRFVACQRQPTTGDSSTVTSKL
jgi:Tyrosine phosphatase family